MKKKVIALALGCTVAFGCAVGGTLAWLTDDGGTVTNTFTVGDINIDLTEEHNALVDGTRNFTFVPGDTLEKDPKVTVQAGSEDCYVFVIVNEANNTVTDLKGKVVNYSIDGAWKLLDGYTNAYYQKVTDVSGTDGWSDYILAGGQEINQNGQVTINDEVTKNMVSGLTSSKPTLTFTAAAVQIKNLADDATKSEAQNAVTAWAELDSTFKDKAVKEPPATN